MTNDILNGTLTTPLSIIRFQAHGVTSIVNNQLIYTPSAGFCGGNDTIDYRICNINGCDTGRVVISVICDTMSNNGNPIVAVNDRISTPKNVSIGFRPTINDTIRTRLSSLMISIAPNHGSIRFNTTDSLTYIPNPEYCGLDTIGYTICDTASRCSDAVIYIAVTCDTMVNNPKPNAVNDLANTRKGSPVTINVLRNDTLNGVLTRPVTVIQTPRHGRISVDNNQITYLPDTAFCGANDTLTYEICNINGCDTAQVLIAVTCPMDTTGGGGGNAIVAVNDRISTPKNVQISFKPTINDTIRTRLLALMVLSSPRHGSISFSGLDTLVYVPNPNYCGLDTLEYNICDTALRCSSAFVYITVICDSIGVNRPPIALNDTASTRVNIGLVINVLLNDTLNGVLINPLSITARPRFGTATVTRTNQIIYTPTNSFCGGRDTLSYQICNANGCDTALVSILVLCDSLTLNRLPIAVPDYANTRKNTPIRITILGNDTLNGVLDSIKIIRSPLLGIAAIGSDNVLTYTPDSCGFTDSLIYRICNRNGCDTAIVTIKVLCDTVILSNRRPVAIDDSSRTSKNRPINIAVMTNDSLFGNRLDTVYITKQPRRGGVAITATNQLLYTPLRDSCNFRDTLEYAICTRNGCDTAQVTLFVACDTMPRLDSLPPIAVFDTITTPKGIALTIAVTLNDTLRGADTFRITRRPRHATAIFDALHNIIYTPDTTYCGRDTLIYEICNTKGCDTAYVAINIICSNLLPPVALNDSAKGQFNKVIRIPIFINDTLRGARTAELTRRPLHGTVVVMPDSTAMFMPDKEFCGKDTFEYRICNTVGCDTARVTIDVSCGDSLVTYTGMSPNGDGRNDGFIVRGIENYPDNEVIIVNRWGNEVFRRKGYRNDEAWKGTWGDKTVPDGTYFYCIFLHDPKGQTKTGYIQILR